MKRLDSLESKIAFFLDSPAKHPSKHKTSEGYHSVLYLLRRDIQHCFFDKGIIEESEVEVRLKTLRCRRIFPGILTIFSGIDLLAKFVAGNDDRREVGLRFKEYLRRYFGNLPEDQIRLIYTVRNCLVHSFGLYDSQGKKGITINSELIGEVVTEIDGYYVLHFKDLCIGFLGSIEKYQTDLQGSKDLQKKFEDMFDRYGFLFYG